MIQQNLSQIYGVVASVSLVHGRMVFKIFCNPPDGSTSTNAYFINVHRQKDIDYLNRVLAVGDSVFVRCHVVVQGSRTFYNLNTTADLLLITKENNSVIQHRLSCSIPNQQNQVGVIEVNVY